MKEKTLQDLERTYNLDLNKIISEIKKKNAKLVLLQFPDGLKPYATTVVDWLEEQCKNVNFLIWLGSCYGSCDVPVLSENLKKKIDIVVQFGHNEMMSEY